MNIHRTIGHSLLQELALNELQVADGLYRSETEVEEPLVLIHNNVNRQIAKNHTIVETLSFILKLYP